MRRRERQIEGDRGREGGTVREKRARMYDGKLLKNVFSIMAFPCTQSTTSCSIIWFSTCIIRKVT